MKDAEDIAHLFAKARADVADLISGLRHEEALSRRRTIIENLASSLEVTGLVARGHHAYEAQLCERRLEGVHPVASVATQTLLEDIDFLRCIVTSQAHLLVQNGDGLTAEHIFVRPILKTAAKEKTEQAAAALIELITTQLAEKEERLSDMQKKRFGERQRLEEEAEQIRRTLRGLRPRSVSNSSEEDVMKRLSELITVRTPFDTMTPPLMS
ncbi:hypothetical protein EV715DRAFT_298008 [Schizophyllum commune]